MNFFSTDGSVSSDPEATRLCHGTLGYASLDSSLDSVDEAWEGTDEEDEEEAGRHDAANSVAEVR